MGEGTWVRDVSSARDAKGETAMLNRELDRGYQADRIAVEFEFLWGVEVSVEACSLDVVEGFQVGRLPHEPAAGAASGEEAVRGQS